MHLRSVANDPTRNALVDPERFRRKTEETIRAVLDCSRLFDQTELLRGVVEKAVQLADAEFGALGIVVSPDEPMNPWVYAGVEPDVAKRIGRPPRPVGVLGEVALAGKTICVRDVQSDRSFHGFPEHHPKLGSLLGVPISFEGRPMGVLYLGNRRGAPEFTDEDTLVVQLLATHAAALVAQARLRSEIAAERTRLRTILEYAPHGILHVDTDGRIMANPAANALLGQNLTGLTFKDYRGRLLRDEGDALIVDGWPPMSPTEMRVVSPEGRETPVRIHAARVPGPSADSTVVILEDISPWKELERLREEFAAVIAHDLRNPANTIQIAVDYVLAGARGTHVRVPADILHRMRRAAARLGDMVTDLLDASRIEARRLNLVKKAVPLANAVSTLLHEIRPTLGDHPTNVQIEGRPLPVLMDPLRLDQILTNLVDNAAKYSSAGAPIQITIAAADDGAVVSVRDSGPGIAAEDLPRLFDRFYQAKRAREKKSGLGLGLYITKGLVEAHGGRIWIDSTQGHGSTFHVWLPTAPAPFTQVAPSS